MANTIDYYLSKGFDKKSAEYFASGRKRIVDVIANDNYTLTIRFDNGEKRLYDVAPLLKQGTVFKILSDKKIFSQVYVDEYNCIAWNIDPNIDSNKVYNNKIDLCSDVCYMDSIPI